MAAPGGLLELTSCRCKKSGYRKVHLYQCKANDLICTDAWIKKHVKISLSNFALKMIRMKNIRSSGCVVQYKTLVVTSLY